LSFVRFLAIFLFPSFPQLCIQLVLRFPCVSVRFCINALDLRETPSRLSLHNNALSLRETPSRLGLHNNALGLRQTPSRLGLHNNALGLRETPSQLGLHNNALSLPVSS
jgi:type III secretory pathway component EscR